MQKCVSLIYYFKCNVFAANTVSVLKMKEKSTNWSELAI